MANIPYNEEEKIMDALSSQKFATDNYNTFANECATPAVKMCLMQILQDEHQIQQELWCEMNARGWYPTEKAEEPKLQQTKSKFQSCL